MSNLVRRAVAFPGMLLMVAALALGACEGAGQVNSDELTGASEESGEELTGTVTTGAQVRVLADLNLRSGPSTSYKVLRVIPQSSLVTTVRSAPSNSFYQISHDGLTGWVHGKYLSLVDEGNGDGDSGNASPDTGSTPLGSSRSAILDRSKSVVGFSYWWGHGRWRSDGATSSTRGTCSGSCPSCSHGGSYGADCSGFVAKAWQVPSSNKDLSDDEHPYSTSDFVNSGSQWSLTTRNSIQPADALVYRSGSSGHIVLYSSGDAWGSFKAYECKSCSAGCVYNLRSVSSAYKTVRRKGL